jgi:hypothetical protein
MSCLSEHKYESLSTLDLPLFTNTKDYFYYIPIYEAFFPHHKHLSQCAIHEHKLTATAQHLSDLHSHITAQSPTVPWSAVLIAAEEHADTVDEDMVDTTRTTDIQTKSVMANKLQHKSSTRDDQVQLA